MLTCGGKKFDVADFVRMQQDVVSLPARRSSKSLEILAPGPGSRAAKVCQRAVGMGRSAARRFAPGADLRGLDCQTRDHDGDNRDAASLDAALAEIEQRFGKDPADWQWGKLHQLTLVHPSGKPEYQLGPVPAPATATRSTRPAARISARPMARRGARSSTCGDWDRSVMTNVPGESGDPASKHYCDLLAGLGRRTVSPDAVLAEGGRGCDRGKDYTATVGVVMQATVPTVSTTVASVEAPRIPQPVPRNIAVDTYRGFVMLLMMAEVLQLSRVAQAFPGNRFWGFLAYHQTHVAWAGCSLHDTIQPGFSFLVGVALPYSIASRIAKGGTFGKMFGHACWRALLLVALGIFLRSMRGPQTYFTFEDTLTQIGFGYPILFLLGFRPPKWQWVALGAILFGYWLAWALYPVPGPGFDYQAVGVPAGLDPQLHGLRRALEQERQPGQRLRPVVPESVPAGQAVRVQQRRLSDPELHSHARHHDPRTDRRAVAARQRPEDPDEEAADRRRHRHRRRPAAALHRHLPGREAHLDPELDALQRRPLLPVPGRHSAG